MENEIILSWANPSREVTEARGEEQIQAQPGPGGLDCPGVPVSTTQTVFYKLSPASC